jgi:hypothetical protein
LEGKAAVVATYTLGLSGNAAFAGVYFWVNCRQLTHEEKRLAFISQTQLKKTLT